MPTIDGPRTTTLCAAALLGARSEVTLPELREALEASAAAGFSAVSLWAAHHQTLVAGGLDPEMLVALHNEAGLSVPVVEAALGWTNPDLDAVDADVGPTLEVAARYGAEQVLAVFMQPEAPEPAAGVAGFARLCDRAAEYDLRVSLEFLPWSGIPDLETAAAIVGAADRPNAGVTLDTWHFSRSQSQLSTLAKLPGHQVGAVQLSDAPATPAATDLPTESIEARLLPGDGDAGLREIVRVLDQIGSKAPIGVEVFSAGLRELPAQEVGRRAGEAARAVLAAARHEP